MVTPQQIRTETNRALAGNKKVRITFGVNNASDTAFLLGMERARVVELSCGELSILAVVSTTRRWDGDRNRTITVTLGPQFDLEWFSDRMCRALDAIEAV